MFNPVQTCKASSVYGVSWLDCTGFARDTRPEADGTGRPGLQRMAFSGWEGKRIASVQRERRKCQRERTPGEGGGMRQPSPPYHLLHQNTDKRSRSCIQK